MQIPTVHIINFFTELSAVEQIESDRKLAELLSMEDDEVELLKCSGISEQNLSDTEELKCSSLHEALNKLSLKTQPETEKEIQFFVQRRYVFKNAFEDVKTSKMITSKMSVEFVGEPAVDTGGPTKEMFSIAFCQPEVLSHISPFCMIKMPWLMDITKHLGNWWLYRF
jgi:hypothetical protein